MRVTVVNSGLFCVHVTSFRHKLINSQKWLTVWVPPPPPPPPQSILKETWIRLGKLLRSRQMRMGAGSIPPSFLESESKSNINLNTTYSSDLSPKKCFWMSATLFFCPNCLPLTLLSALTVPLAGTPLSTLRKRKKDSPSCTSLRHGWRHSTWIRSHSPWAPSSLNWAVDRCLIENWDCENCTMQY